MATYALFIKRAEENHTKEFITEAFASNQIGKVSDVTFIQKCSDTGHPYNGVIVNFETLNDNMVVSNLFNQMNSSKDGTTRFYFGKTRYWIINVHKSKTYEHNEIVFSQELDIQLSDQDRIRQLELLVHSLTQDINYAKHKETETNNQIYNISKENTYQHLQIMELHSQLEEKERREMELMNRINKLEIQNSQLENELEVTIRELEERGEECIVLKEDIYDEVATRKYMEEQVKDIVEMIKEVNDNDVAKEKLNMYILNYVR